MTKMIFVSLPMVTDLQASITFYKALGLDQNLHFSDDSAACMVWSEAIYVMLLTHAKWRTFTQRPFPPAGSAGLMLSLSLESRPTSRTRPRWPRRGRPGLPSGAWASTRQAGCASAASARRACSSTATATARETEGKS